MSYVHIYAILFFREINYKLVSLLKIVGVGEIDEGD